MRSSLAQKIAANHQMRKVLAHLERTAGWWTIKPGEPGVHDDPPGRYDGTELYNGDGPADMMDDVLDDIDQAYRQSWGRPATPEELRAVFEFVFRCTEEADPRCNPLNQWIDEAIEILGVPMKSFMALSKEKRDELAQAHRDYRNQGRTPELYQRFVDMLTASWKFAQEDAERMLKRAGADDGKKTGDRTGVGFFLPVPKELADQFPPLGEEDKSKPHATFLYVGNVPADQEEAFLKASREALSEIREPVRAHLQGPEYFVHPDKGRRVALMGLRYSHDMAGIRWKLRDKLIDAGIQVDDKFPLIYRPHVTLAYLDGLTAVYKGDVPKGDWEFNSIEVWGLPKVHNIEFGAATANRVATTHLGEMTDKASRALMKFLADAARKLGVAKDTYVVGGAVRNFVIDRPIKDIDVVIDSIAAGRDSEWFAKKLQRVIPAQTNLTTNNYGVAILTIKGDWEVGGANLNGEVIEIANARKESYGGQAGKGYKPHMVEPSTIQEDVIRREFTFNTLMWRLLDLAKGPDKAEIIDLTGCGLRDLQEGVARCPQHPDKVFTDDPSRMVRAIKFLLKYGLKIAPDVEASIKKNRQKLKNIPSAHLSNMIINVFYEGGVGKKALLEMKRLGLLDVVKEIAQTDKSFASALGNWADKKADLTFLFDLMDLGMPAGRRLGFLDARQRQRVREITVQMSADEADAFVTMLGQPGKILDMKGLANEFGLKGKEFQKITEAARMALLSDPVLAVNPRRLEDKVRQILSKGGRLAQVRTALRGAPEAHPEWMVWLGTPMVDNYTHYLMDVKNDEFVHFTTNRRARLILADGKLKMNPPYKKFGTDNVTAVSSRWGHFVPRVQTTHIKPEKGEKLVAITFQTPTVPKYGYPEEVVWDRDVVLKNAKMIPFEKGVSMLKKTPYRLPVHDEDDVVFYRVPSEVQGGKIAATFNLNVGDSILYGKYKNKKGIIKSFSTNEKGDVLVTIEPYPKGRKQDKELKLFKIRPAPEPWPVEKGASAESVVLKHQERLAQHYPYQECLADGKKEGLNEEEARYRCQWIACCQSKRENKFKETGFCDDFNCDKKPKWKKAKLTEVEKLPEFANDFRVGWASFNQKAEMAVAEGWEDNRSTARALNRTWVFLINNTRPYIEALIDLKAIPKGKHKEMELAARHYMAVRRTPQKMLAWWKKAKRFEPLLKEAVNWPAKTLGGEEMFKLGPFTVHNTVGLTGKKLETVKKALQQAVRAIKSSPAPKDLKKALYGDVFIVAQVQQAKMLAWYDPSRDDFYVRPFLKVGREVVHNIIHELSHRWWKKFANKSDRTFWVQHHWDVENQVPDVDMPDVGDELPVKVKGYHGPIRVDYKDLTGKYGFTVTIGGQERHLEVPVRAVRNALTKMEKIKRNFPTPYSSKNYEEHFCEAAAMRAMGKLPPEHVEAFDLIWTGKGDKAIKRASTNVKYTELKLDDEDGKEIGSWVIPEDSVPLLISDAPLVENVAQRFASRIAGDGEAFEEGERAVLGPMTGEPEYVWAEVLETTGKCIGNILIESPYGEESTDCDNVTPYERWQKLHPNATPAERVAAKYQKKKEVPKADGNGTTTVYEYSEGQVQHRNREKAKRVEKLRGKLGDLQKKVKKDLKSKDLKTRLTALAVGLINDTYERVGNPDSAKDGHFGVTGWQAKHVTISKDGNTATIKYIGKSGVSQEKETRDPDIIRVLKEAVENKSGTDPVFEVGDVTVNSTVVNDYLKPMDITAKDIRGLHANRVMQDKLQAIRKKGDPAPGDKKEREKKFKEEFKKALEETAKEVGHEPSTLKSQYLVPGLEDTYLATGQVKKNLAKQASGGGFDEAMEIIEHYRQVFGDILFPPPHPKPSPVDERLIKLYVRRGETMPQLLRQGEAYTHRPMTCVVCGSTHKCRCSQKIHDIYGYDTRPIESVCYDCVEAAGLADKLASRSKQAAMSKQTIININNATDGDTLELRGFNGLISSLTLYERAVVQDMNSHGLPIMDEGGRYTLRGHQVEPGAVRELIGAGYLQEDGDVVRLSDMFEVKLRLYKSATKTPAEKEDEAIEDLVKPMPRKKPPRKDLKKERVDLGDEDTEEGTADTDEDLSLNYKRVAARWIARQAGKVPEDAEDKKPGDYWQTEGGEWGVRLPDGEYSHAKNEENAAAMAAGKVKPGEEEEPEEAKKPGEDEDKAPKITLTEEEKTKALTDAAKAQGLNFPEELEPEEAEAAEKEALSKKIQAEKEKAEAEAKEAERKQLEKDIKNITSDALKFGDKTFADVVKDMDEKDQRKLVDAYREEKDRLKQGVFAGGEVSDEMMEAARKALAGEISTKGKGVGQLGKEMASRMLAKKIVANPAIVGGEKISDQPKDKAQLKERMNQAFDQFQGMPPEVRKSAMEQMQVLLDKEKDDNKLLELQAITNGLAMASLVNDEPLAPLRDEPAEDMRVLAKALDEKGEATKLLGMSLEEYHSPEGRDLLSDAMDSMDDSEVYAVLGGEGGPFGPIIRGLQQGDFNKDTAAILLDLAKTLHLDGMTNIHSFLVESAKEGGKPIKDPKKRDKKVKSVMEAIKGSDELFREMESVAKNCEGTDLDPETLNKCQELAKKLRVRQIELAQENAKEEFGDPPPGTPLTVQIAEAAAEQNADLLSKKYVSQAKEGQSFAARPKVFQSSFYTWGLISKGQVCARADHPRMETRRRNQTMAKKLTKKGAQAVSADLDKLANLFEHDFEILGVEQRIAHDFALRCDMLSDHLEKVALTGDDVVKEQGFDPDDIGREKAGPLENEPDEPYMRGEFDQQENRELREKQQDGEIGPDRISPEPQAPRPGVQAALGTLAAAIGDGSLPKEAAEQVEKALSLATTVVREAKGLPEALKEHQFKKDDDKDDDKGKDKKAADDSEEEAAKSMQEKKEEAKEEKKASADHGYDLTAE